MMENEVVFDLAFAQLKGLLYYLDNDALDHQGDREAAERITALGPLVQELVGRVERSMNDLKRDCAKLRATA